jgi:hypothetical protein
MDRDERRDEREHEHRGEQENPDQQAREAEQKRDRDDEHHAGERAEERNRDWRSNPPRTTTGKMTSPKFGSATSGGGEFEPGPERD